MQVIANEAQARDYVTELGDPSSIRKLDRFANLLRDESERQNLVSRSSLEQLWIRHFADSAQLLDHVPRETGRWLDLGSGAGFPGLVIASLRPDAEMTLVESRPLRTKWLADATEALSLPNVRIFSGRVEDCPAFQAGVITARAFAPLPRLLELSARFSTDQTVWLLPKGRSARQELAGMDGSGRKMFHVEPSRTSHDAGIIVGRGRIGAGQ